MKYFLDTEFLEGTQKKLFGEIKPTIDLISIGIVCEDGREYYAINKDFNLKEAWNRYDIKSMSGKGGIGENTRDKIYWIRENVLKSIWIEKCEEGFSFKNSPMTPYGIESLFTYKNFKKLIRKYGKSNKQIANEIIEFCKPVEGHIYLAGTDSYEQVNIGRPNTIVPAKHWTETIGKRTTPQFYGYYSDYDWVVFCWLFGKMIDLPKGFPMYCIDLKQTLDEIVKKSWKDVEMSTWGHNGIEDITRLPNYPKQTNEHNALADARWNFELYKFLNTL